MGRNHAPVNQGTSIYDIFVKDQVYSGNMTIAYCIKEHKLADFFTKYLQEYLFVKFCEGVMGRNHVDTSHMGPPSSKYSVENLDEFNTSKNKKEEEFHIRI